MCTGVDLIYTVLMQRADRNDGIAVQAQLMHGVEEGDEVLDSLHRDSIDQQLLEPVGDDATDMQDLITYLRS